MAAKIDEKSLTAFDSVIKTIEVSPHARTFLFIVCALLFLFLVYLVLKLFFRPASEQRYEKALAATKSELAALNTNVRLVMDRQDTFARLCESIHAGNSEIRERVGVIDTRLDYLNRGGA